MVQKMSAVYQDGVLRPDSPLALANGEHVEVIILTPTQGGTSPEHSEADDDYDVLEALNANRLAEGARPLLPPEQAP